MAFTTLKSLPKSTMCRDSRGKKTSAARRHMKNGADVIDWAVRSRRPLFRHWRPGEGVGDGGPPRFHRLSDPRDRSSRPGGAELVLSVNSSNLSGADSARSCGHSGQATTLAGLEQSMEKLSAWAYAQDRSGAGR